MARKDRQQPISMKFVFLFVITVIGILVYAFTPNEMAKINSPKDFHEMLEYNPSATGAPKRKVNPNEIQKQLANKKIVSSESFAKKNKAVTGLQQNSELPPNIQQSNHQEQKLSEEEQYNVLLDDLRMYPTRSTDTIVLIVNKLLQHKGYYADTVRVEIDDIPKNVQIQGSYIAAIFDFQSGKMYVNKDRIFEMKKEEVIAVLAHELDHFDKLACVCKSMGVSDFIRQLRENKLENVDASFWTNASQKANLSGFDSEKYKEALFRYINQNSIDLVSSYSDFYRLSENIRNPLEISAYEVSDYILNHYGLPHNEGSVYKLVRVFNEVDWAIHNSINKISSIKDERITFFDYYFMKAISESNARYSSVLNSCQYNNNGDLSAFWLAFEQDNMSFYDKRRQVTPQTYSTMYDLLSKMKDIIDAELNKDIIFEALNYKVKTLLSNIVYPNAIKNIRKAINSYFEYSKRQNVSDSKLDLEFLLTLVCIENELYKTNVNNEISLYYIKIPSELSSYRNISERKDLLRFVYKNDYFKQLLEQKKKINSSMTDQDLLIDLLNQSRLDVKVKM